MGYSSPIKIDNTEKAGCGTAKGKISELFNITINRQVVKFHVLVLLSWLVVIQPLKLLHHHHLHTSPQNFSTPLKDLNSDFETGSPSPKAELSTPFNVMRSISQSFWPSLSFQEKTMSNWNLWNLMNCRRMKPRITKFEGREGSKSSWKRFGGYSNIMKLHISFHNSKAIYFAPNLEEIKHNYES